MVCGAFFSVWYEYLAVYETDLFCMIFVLVGASFSVVIEVFDVVVYTKGFVFVS